MNNPINKRDPRGMMGEPPPPILPDPADDLGNIPFTEKEMEYIIWKMREARKDYLAQLRRIQSQAKRLETAWAQTQMANQMGQWHLEDRIKRIDRNIGLLLTAKHIFAEKSSHDRIRWASRVAQQHEYFINVNLHWKGGDPPWPPPPKEPDPPK
jgi:hypothetical protein